MDDSDPSVRAVKPGFDRQIAAGGENGGRREAPSARILGFMAVIFLLALIWLLYYATDGTFLPSHWVALYVAIAIVTGVLFWNFTTTDADVSLPALGIRLGGGAAVGAAFMILAHWLTPGAAMFRIVDIQFEGVDSFSYQGERDLRRVEPLNKETEFLVEFQESVDEGYFEVHFLKEGQPHRGRQTVRRDGPLQALELIPVE